MSKDVCLIFPPATDPRSPHLAIPALTAFLRNSGISVQQLDLDIKCFSWIIEQENLRNCYRKLANQNGSENWINHRPNHADFILENISESCKILRDKTRFYNPKDFLQSRECIVRALKMVSAANGYVNYNIGPILYDVIGYNATRLKDLEIITKDPRFNLFYRYYEDHLIKELESSQPQIVGISILNFQQVVPGLTLARFLKNKGYFTVIGGTLYSKFVNKLLYQPRLFELFCDGIIVYEGETALLELVNQIKGNGIRDFSKVPNFIYQNHQGEILMHGTHVENVNKLPTPDFSGLPLDEYLAPYPILPILTGKGCYFNLCKFCDIPSINSISSKRYRLRSPDIIAKDVLKLHNQYRTRFFQITDEALSPKLLSKLAEVFKPHQHLDLRFVGYARLEEGFTPDNCQKIQKMGFRKLFFGLESGSQKTLDHMKKGIKISHVPQILKNCSDAGIAFHLFSIIGFPEEKEIDAYKTLNFFLDNKELINHPRNSFDIHQFMLDLRTDYSNNPQLYGIKIDNPNHESFDFPLSIENWENLNGLNETQVRKLITKFSKILRQHFPEYRQYPVHIWPGFEEYSLLYSDFYEKKPFSFRFNLPLFQEPNKHMFKLKWSNSVYFETKQHLCTVFCLTGNVSISNVTLKILIKSNGLFEGEYFLDNLVSKLQIPDQLLSSAKEKVRQEIDKLLAIGAIYFEPVN